MFKFSLATLVSMAALHPVFAAVDIQAESVQGPDVDGNEFRLAYLDDANQFDLIDSGQASLLGLTSTETFNQAANQASNQFLADNINDGVYGAGSTNNAFYDPTVLPATVTVDLKTDIAPEGYNLTSITSFFGWGGQSATQANQVYDVYVSLVGSDSYTLLAEVDYTPFAAGPTQVGVSDAYESKVVITEDSAAPLASGVDSIRFVFEDPGAPDGQGYGVGSVIREIDVVGFAVGDDPSALGIISPTPRQVVQRTPTNIGSIPVSGTFIATSDRIEARAVLRTGSEDTGMSTGWQTIETSPTGGTFSGSLDNVTAGGWYDIEIRSIVEGAPGMATSIQRVGVGDIYITAGQSNSANAGSPTAAPTSDRVSARNSLTENTWVVAADPQPLAQGIGGSPWSRLGDILETRENVPIAFISIGRLNSKVADWTPGDLFYNTLLLPALEAFPENGFSALLWHQGEADSGERTTAASYEATIGQIISQSRTEVEWDYPFYISEASYISSRTLNIEESVMAGQRGAAFNFDKVFLGADTNGFHNEGRSSDGTHFNAAGLQEHALQWANILTGQTTVTPVNGDFEKNTGPLTSFPPLGDNEFSETIINENDGDFLLDWSILTSSGTSAADGTNGYFNPGPDTYSRSASISELTNLSGRHVATLRGGGSGNYLLQTLRSLAEPNQTYLLTVAVGIRDVGGDAFGGVKLELLNGRSVIGQRSVDINTMNTLAGGSAAGKFTNVTLRVNSGNISGQPHELGIRIAKVTGGGNTYLDVDNVTLDKISTNSPFLAWLDTNNLDASPNDDTDGDGLRNLVEYALGTSPTVVNENTVLTELEPSGVYRLTRRIGSQAKLAYAIQRSTNLVDWFDITNLNTNVVSSSGGFEVVNLSRPGGWIGTSGEEYYRFKVTITE